jgi:hypothetical protein
MNTEPCGFRGITELHALGEALLLLRDVQKVVGGEMCPDLPALCRKERGKLVATPMGWMRVFSLKTG